MAVLENISDVQMDPHNNIRCRDYINY